MNEKRETLLFLEVLKKGENSRDIFVPST